MLDWKSAAIFTAAPATPRTPNAAYFECLLTSVKLVFVFFAIVSVVADAAFAAPSRRASSPVAAETPCAWTRIDRTAAGFNVDPVSRPASPLPAELHADGT